MTSDEAQKEFVECTTRIKHLEGLLIRVCDMITKQMYRQTAAKRLRDELKQQEKQP